MLRPAVIGDSELLYRWRLEAETADYWDGTPVSALQHLTWLQARIDNPLVSLLVWEEDGEPAGTVRIDSNGELAFHAVSDEVAVEMLAEAVRWHTLVHGGRLKASVDEADSATWRALKAVGFQRDRSVKFFLFRS